MGDDPSDPQPDTGYDDAGVPTFDAVRDKKHGEQVTYLKENFGMGHGHANALVAVYRKDNGL